MDKNKIGCDAGVLWRLMNEKRDKSVWDLEELRQAAGMDIPDFFAAVGWLARENKVDFGRNGITQDNTVGLIVDFYY